ncbi:MAG: hypothetical protein WA395_15715 [Nitrososphaeraceae archaeon]
MIICLDCGKAIRTSETDLTELCDVCAGIRKRAFWGSFIMLMKNKSNSSGDDGSTKE